MGEEATLATQPTVPEIIRVTPIARLTTRTRWTSSGRL